MRSTLFVVLLALLPIAAEATLLIDQQQPAFDLSYPPLEIGGPMDKRLAQTFTVGIEGIMREVHLPVHCESGVLIVEIVELDGDAPAAIGMLDRGLREAVSLPPTDPPVFRSIPLDELPPPPGSRFPPGSPSFVARPGDRFAFVVSNPTGRCTMPRGIAIDPYAGGHGFFDERPLPRGWLRLDGNIEPSDDLPFKTAMDGDPPSSPCDLFGVTANPLIPAFLPVCRCLEDAALREQRCTLLHPSFFMIRRLPFPLHPGETFEISWTLIPLTDIGGSVEVKESLPKEMQSFVKKPLVFRAEHIKPGASVTLEYKAVAAKGGTFAVESVITSPKDVQKVRSFVEIEPPPK